MRVLAIVFRAHRALGVFRRDERGQAAPMAAFGILAMVLAVLATLNLGQAVHQKIKLQNTADSAAYTLAAMEARTFNYIAFLNRAQIAHYNTAMVVQSYMTWIGFHVALFGTALDIVVTMRNAAERGCQVTRICKYGGPRCWYCMLQGFMSMAIMGLEGIRTALRSLMDTADDLGHDIVEAMAIFNRDAVYQSQFSRAVLLNGHIMTGMQSYISKLDPDLQFTKGRSSILNMFVNSALNSIEYYQTFDRASGVNPFALSLFKDIKRVTPRTGEYYQRQDGEDGSRPAWRLMAELCHATRTPEFVSNRSDRVTYSIPAASMYPHVVSGQKLGQTRFTSEASMENARIRAIDEETFYPEGAYLSSDDFLGRSQGTGSAMLGIAWVFLRYRGSNELGDAIEAYEEQGKHYRYTDGGTSGIISPQGRGMTVMPANISPGSPSSSHEEQSGHAPWLGFAPYFKFKPNKDRTRDFNQPSTWIFLNKHHKDFQTDSPSHSDGRAPWYSNFSWHNHGQVVRLNTEIGGSRNSYLFEGLNVLSRGMAYYHRPGNWAEHPNFFNPYWRARLAPVGQKLQNFWDRWVTKKIKTDSDSKVVQGMVGFLKNAQMDLFTAAITSVITH